MLDRTGTDALTVRYGHETLRQNHETKPVFFFSCLRVLRGWRRRVGAYGQSARRDRVRSVAQVCAAGRRARAHRISAIGHGDRGGVPISDRRDDRFRTAAWTAGIAGRGRRADRPPVVRRRRDRRHAVVVAARRRDRMDGRARTRRSRGLCHSLGERRRPCRHRHRIGGRNRRAVRHVPFSSTPSNSCAARRPRHRRASTPGAPAAQSLGQSRRHHRARLRRRLAVVARPRRPASRGLCPRQRVDRHQRHRHQQRQREPAVAHPTASRESRGHRSASSGPMASACIWPPISRLPRCWAA